MIVITVTFPSGAIEEYQVESETAIIGRSKKCDIPIEIDGVSRQHLKLEYENGNFYVTDLKSLNGVFIDDKRLPSEVKTMYQTFLPLKMGGEIYFSVVYKEEVSQLTGSKKVKMPKMSDPTSPTVSLDDENTPKYQLDSLKKSSLPKTPKIAEKKQTNNQTILIALLLIVAAAAYYYLEIMEPM